MLVSANFKERALKALNGNWGVAIGTGLVASLLGAYTAISSGSGGSSSSGNSKAVIEMLSQLLPREVVQTIATVFGIIALVALVYAIVKFIIGGPITLGYAKFNLNMVNGNRPRFSDLFSQFGRFKEAFCMQFLRGLFIFLWSLLLVIPGIIAGFSYAMAPYILYENPGMSASEAIEASKKMMDGNKWRLFCLNFSFIGWAILAILTLEIFSFIGWPILAILTLGIGLLWLNPYMEASYAAFYEELKREQSVRSAQTDSNYSL